ncbi:MAG: hypothetical protein PHV62_03375 [Sulfuricurvum sp.]|nr:hypothetical protein [Sulfuricurvum sp.]
MNELNYLLVILVEECGEVQDAIHDSLPISDLIIELRDVIATIDLINKNGGLGVQLPCTFDSFNKTPIKNDTIFKCVNKMQYYILKGFRFGFDDIRPGYTINNAEQLQNLSERYIQTIRAFFNTLPEINPSVAISKVFDADGILAKQTRIKFWMQHSISKGLLTIDGENNEK